jgi:hypothetical protein
MIRGIARQLSQRRGHTLAAPDVSEAKSVALIRIASPDCAAPIRATALARREREVVCGLDVIARSEATKQSSLLSCCRMDCFAELGIKRAPDKSLLWRHANRHVDKSEHATKGSV